MYEVSDITKNNPKTVFAWVKDGVWTEQKFVEYMNMVVYDTMMKTYDRVDEDKARKKNTK